MRSPSLHAILPAALVGCLLAAPVAFAADGEDTKLNLGSADEAAKSTAANSASTGGNLVRTIVGLAVVLGVIYGLHWVLKQVKSSKDGADAGDSLETIASLSLGTNRSLHLVRVGARSSCWAPPSIRSPRSAATARPRRMRWVCSIRRR